MEVTSEKSYPWAFVLAPEEIERLASLIAQVADEELLIEAECFDELSRQFKDSAALLNYENLRPMHITALKLDGGSARLVLSDQPDAGISLYLRGDERAVLDCRDRILAQLRDSQPWYARITSGKVDGILSVVVAVIPASVAAWLLFRYGSIEGDFSVAAGFFTFLAYIPIQAVLPKIKRRFFPVGTFLIGGGKKRHAHLEQARWTVIIGSLVSVAVAFIFWII